MYFAKLEDTKLNYALQDYTDEEEKIVIYNFPHYLEVMYTNENYDKMYGFKLVEDIQPTYNADTQYLTIDSYIETETKITIVYTINNLEIVEPAESLEDKVVRLEQENKEIKTQLEDVSMYAIENSVDTDYRLTLLEINAMNK